MTRFCGVANCALWSMYRLPRVAWCFGETTMINDIHEKTQTKRHEAISRVAAGGRRFKQIYDRTKSGAIAAIVFVLLIISVAINLLIGNSKLLSFSVSLTLLALVFLLFKCGPFFRSEFARAIRAMWLPIVVAVVAAILLFYEDQGRDLGVGLIGEGQTKLIMLCLILVFWAINNWHSARIGLNYEFPEPTGKEWRLFWPPRLLGVSAHLVAAFSLASAGLDVSTAAGGSSPALKLSNGLVFAAPATIVLVTISVWAFDIAHWSKNRAKLFSSTVAWVIVGASFVLVVAILIGLWWVANRELVPDGLFAGTAWISLSAVIFLGFVSRVRREFDPAPQNHDLLTAGLALFAVVVGAIICLTPTFVGDWLGSLNVLFFAFGAVLAVINGIGLFGRHVVNMNNSASRFKFAGGFVAFLALLAALTSFFRDFHRVRLCTATEVCQSVPRQAAWSPIPTVDDRPSVREAALAWYDQAKEFYPKGENDEQKPVPMLVIATAGGGIRAAYWTATILQKLQNDLKKKGKSLDKLLFAISGVSGGSVGAMNYIAALDAGDEATTHLQSDFLAPAIASLVFADGPSNFLPDFGQVDRGTALERSFENASKGYLGYSFLSFFPNKSNLSSNWRPALLLNATHQETGRRIIASNLKIDKETFLDSFDELELLNADMRASTVAHNSARFTYVSPAGKLVPNLPSRIENRGYVLDGGYFENYGALTALELARSARQEIERTGGSVKLVILQISSDPTLTKDRPRVRTVENGGGCFLTTANVPVLSSNKDNYLSFADAGRDPVTHRWHNNDGEGVGVAYLNELAAPLIGVTAVREAHGRIAAAELASAVCVERDAVRAAQQSADKQPPAAMNDLLVAKTDSKRVASGQTPPAPLAPNAPKQTPHFAHLAMCEVSEINRAPIVPPLGWVLSKPMREKFAAIFDDCGNPAELVGLEMALQ
jgi:hypothetical protein